MNNRKKIDPQSKVARSEKELEVQKTLVADRLKALTARRAAQAGEAKREAVKETEHTEEHIEEDTEEDTDETELLRGMITRPNLRTVVDSRIYDIVCCDPAFSEGGFTELVKLELERIVRSELRNMIRQQLSYIKADVRGIVREENITSYTRESLDMLYDDAEQEADAEDAINKALTSNQQVGGSAHE
jgi:hypothetical protein